MKILNTRPFPCDKCGGNTPQFLSLTLDKRVCSQCGTDYPAQPEDFFKPKPEAVVVTHGGPERNV